MKFVTIDVLGKVDPESGREILIGMVNRSKHSFIAVEHIVLIGVKEDKVYLTTTTGEVLICSMSILPLLKPLLS